MVTAFKLPRHPEAFSKSPATGKRRPREKDEGYLRWIRTLPCIITGTRPVEAAHIRMADPRFAKPQSGMSEKPHDKWALPLSPDKHRFQHSMNEREFWARFGLDPCQIASALYGCGQDDEAAEAILRNARQMAATMVKPSC